MSTYQHHPYHAYQAPLRTPGQLAAWAQATMLVVVLFCGAVIIATMLALMVLL